MYGYDSYGGYGGLHTAGIASAVFGILMLLSFVASIALTVLGYIKFARVPGEKLFDFTSKDAVGPFLRFDTFLLERILKILYMFTSLFFAFTCVSAGISSLILDFLAGLITLLMLTVFVVLGEVGIRMVYESSMLRVVIARNTTQIRRVLDQAGGSLNVPSSIKQARGQGGVHLADGGLAPLPQRAGADRVFEKQDNAAPRHKLCPTCGATLSADAHFCGSCGTRI